jgi:hypothetical protein
MNGFDDDSGSKFDFAGLIRSLNLDTGQPSRADERESEDNVANLAAWRRISASKMPAWPWANWGNEEWTRHVSPPTRAALEPWKPLTFAGGAFKVGSARFVIGPSGCGKSSGVLASLSAASRAARLAAEASRHGFRTAPTLVWTSESCLVGEQYHRVTDALFRKAVGADILVIDELGTSGGHAAQVGVTPVIAGLLDARYNAGKTTIATSGIPRQELVERYGSGVFRRLVHGSVVVDLFTGV